MTEEELEKKRLKLEANREKRRTRTASSTIIQSQDKKSSDRIHGLSEFKKRMYVEDDDDDDDDAYSSADDKPSRPRKTAKALKPMYDAVPISRTGSSAVSRDPNRKCGVCGTKETPQWRRGPNGKRSLCNACGVKWSSGRLTVAGSPGSPFPFQMTESENAETSDNASAVEEIEVGSTAWQLQLEVSRLKSKLRETDRNHKRLIKLLSEGRSADREIDQFYRQIISAAKKSNARIYSPSKTYEFEDLFHKPQDISELLNDPKVEIRYGDATEKDVSLEKSYISKFISIIKNRA